MSDLIERLREHAPRCIAEQLCYEAAAELSRLTAEVERLRANDGRPQSAEEAITRQGVYKGADGLRRFANAAEFWERQMYGTRLYFGPGGADYLHHSVLQSAIDALDGKQRQPAIDAAIKEAGHG